MAEIDWRHVALLQQRIDWRVIARMLVNVHVVESGAGSDDHRAALLLETTLEVEGRRAEHGSKCGANRAEQIGRHDMDRVARLAVLFA